MSRSGSDNEATVLRVVLRSPTHAKAISAQIGLHRATVGSILGRLQARKAIIRIGSEAGNGIWAAPGTPMLRETAPARGTDNARIAGRIDQKYRGFVWGAGA